MVIGFASACNVAPAGVADDRVVAAEPLPEVCRSPDIVTLTRPRSSLDPQRGTFTYRFRYRVPARPELPTLVHLPGGPGSTSIGKVGGWVPTDFGLVETDPRGVGCNQVADVDGPSFYTSDEIEADVVAALAELKRLGLGRFVLHGHSYGTLLATRVAHRLTEVDQPKPEAVILEGVLGRAFTGDEWMHQGYADEWTFQRASLSAAARAALREPSPLGLDGRTWGKFFMFATSQLGPRSTHNFLALLEPDADGAPVAAKRERLRAAVQAYGAIPLFGEEALDIYRLVSCREISSDVTPSGVGVVLADGEILKAEDVGSLCRGLTVERPFHVRDHLFPFPTYYFLGEHDSATPLWQGKLHFDTLTTADRVEVIVKDAGHLPLSSDLFACGPALLERMASGRAIDDVLATCRVAIDQRSARAATP